MKKAYIAGWDNTVVKMLNNEGWAITRVMSEASCVIFTGGEDVKPSLYNHEAHSSTFFNERRDTLEVHYYHEAKQRGIPMAGICRGGQLLNVLSGGTMYQDVTNHAMGPHYAEINGEIIVVSSTHHQMMNPGVNGDVVGIGFDTGAEKTYYSPEKGGFLTEEGGSSDDIEVVLYDGIVCFQPHPEYSLYRENLIPCKDMFFKLVGNILK